MPKSEAEHSRPVELQNEPHHLRWQRRPPPVLACHPALRGAHGVVSKAKSVNVGVVLKSLPRFKTIVPFYDVQ